MSTVGSLGPKYTVRAPCASRVNKADYRYISACRQAMKIQQGYVVRQRAHLKYSKARETANMYVQKDLSSSVTELESGVSTVLFDRTVRMRVQFVHVHSVFVRTTISAREASTHTHTHSSNYPFHSLAKKYSTGMWGLYHQQPRPRTVCVCVLCVCMFA